MNSTGKLILCIIVGLSVNGLALWMLTTREDPEHSILLLLVLLVFAAPPIGAFWMMYMSIRFQKNPFPMILLAMFIPYSFVWYYIEHVRGKRLQRAAI
ncbi:MAG: hypothetical protein JWO13_3413 [Acidobacteriales bacterium]|nr:hypothetical protein [Terriglobales bacterium]